MEWCVRKNLLLDRRGGGGEGTDGSGDDRAGVLIDGVVTDDPALFLEVCERIEDEDEDDEFDNIIEATPVTDRIGLAKLEKERSQATVTTRTFSSNAVGAPYRR